MDRMVSDRIIKSVYLLIVERSLGEVAALYVGTFYGTGWRGSSVQVRGLLPETTAKRKRQYLCVGDRCTVPAGVYL